MEGEYKTNERFKFHDKDAEQQFKKVTTDTKQLSNIVKKKEPPSMVSKKLIKRIKGFVHETF